LALKECLLNELKQKEDGSGVTDYDESLYTNMNFFWYLFSTGRLTSTVTCTTCGTIFTTDSSFDALLLQFPEPHHQSDQDCTVEDLIAHHCEIENISDYQCDHCNGRTLGKKVLAITTCPPLLCIVLGRKKQDGGSIKSSVLFPVIGLNITEDGLQYNLIGTIHHKPSSAETGHYTSICHSLRSQSRRWFNYDDHQVSISKFTSMKNDRVLKDHTRSATILFYVSGEFQTHNGHVGKMRVPVHHLSSSKLECRPNELARGHFGGASKYSVAINSFVYFIS
jgi:ubiquitin C-terminal hydrolase